MARKPMVIDQQALDTLRNYVRTKSNLNCTSYSDIQTLKYKIKKTTDDCLSTQTLNRFFGLVTTNFNPAMDTLNILAKYVKYNSFKEFEFLLHEKIHTTDKASPASKFILSIFSQIEPEYVNEKGLLQVLKNIYKLIEADETLAEELYPFMASSDFGRRYFFQQFINIDSLNGHYGNGLQYYLLHASDSEQLVLGHSLQCLRYFLSDHPVKFQYYYKKLESLDISDVSEYHPMIAARYYAARLFNGKLNNEKVGLTDQCIELVRKEKSRLPFSNKAFPWAEYILGEALILIGDEYAAWELLSQCFFGFDNLPDYMDEGFIAQLELLKLFAGYFTGKVKVSTAIKMLEKIKSRNFYFLSEDYFSLFVYMLEKDLVETSSAQKSIDDSLKLLVEKTRFSHFYTLMLSFSIKEHSFHINRN